MKILLLHAMPLDERMWEPQLEALAGEDVEAPNLYDLGGSSVDEWAERLLESTDDDELAVIGASMGGYVALAMARKAPERVRGLLLVGSRVGADTSERRAVRDEQIRTLQEEGIDAWAPSAPAPPPPERTVDELVRSVQALRDRRDSTELARSFQGPLWVAVGDADPFLPVDEAREIVEGAPNGRLEIFADTGHFPSRDGPDRFNELLREFLQAAA
ncbi:MAG TPA: alpha/beta hydrolase [Gaiellaceae bacterium]|nr:alpha/beta hydrolase [Gaiellaceae bacterium]